MEDRVPLIRFGYLSSRFRRRVVTIAPGGALPYRRSAWRDAIVLILRGSVEIEASDGGRYAFGSDDVLWLDGLPVLLLRNPGSVAAVMVAISRRTTDPSCAIPPSYE